MSSKQIYKSIKKILNNKLKTNIISREEYFHLLNAERRDIIIITQKLN